MWLKKINLFNFRNFYKKSFNFSPFVTIVLGENAKGKTNLLEAIYCLSKGKGFREKEEVELINFKRNQAKIEGIFEEKDQQFIYQVLIEQKNKGVIKQYFIDKIKKNWRQFVRLSAKVVLFSPQDLRIIDGSPEERRNYFDRFLAEEDNEYRKKLINYSNALKKRNKLLENFKKENREIFLKELSFWDKYLIEESFYLIEKRKKYCDFLNKNCFVEDKEFFIDYKPNIINKNRLESVFEEEIRQKKTLIGPQRDNFLIFLKNEKEKNIHLFGSRSEQRLVLFWLKLNEIKYLEEIFKTRPILLLDDLFSEFDQKNRRLILSLIKNYQTIITTTEKEIIYLIDCLKTLLII